MNCRHQIRNKTPYKVKKGKKMYFFSTKCMERFNEYYLFLLNKLTLIQFGSAYILQKFFNSTMISRTLLFSILVTSKV